MSLIIDSHCHLGELNVHYDMEKFIRKLITPELEELGMKPSMMHTDVGKLVAAMDKNRVDKAVILGYDVKRTYNSKVPNDYVAEVVKKYPDKFIGFASVDPLGGMKSIHELDEAVNKLELRGLKMLPSYAHCACNDTRVFTIYERAQELDIPVLLHMGWAPLPDNLMKWQVPLPLEEVALAFPELKIIVGHAAWPWVDDCLVLMASHRNVYADFALWFNFPLFLEEMTRTIVKAKQMHVMNRLLWGTDYPAVESFGGYGAYIEVVRRIPNEARRLGLPPITQNDISKLLGENAKELLKI